MPHVIDVQDGCAFALDHDLVERARLLIRPDELLVAQVLLYREIARGRTFILGQIERRSCADRALA